MTCRKDRGQEDWRGILKGGFACAGDLPPELATAGKAVEAVRSVYPMSVNAYYAGLISRPDDAIARQVIPDSRELEDTGLDDDPLAENQQSPAPGIIHRYPDRVIFLVSGRCPVLCRFCMRKRMAGRSAGPTPAGMKTALAYIQGNTAIREVILSGGDPFMLEDRALDRVLQSIRDFSHVRTIRIHSRVPCALPQRVTDELAAMLKKYHPLYVNIHFNHPDEVTETAARACARLADAGIPLGSQTVLLRGINDSPEVMARLMRALLAIRVRPYYLHHPDLVKGTAHFRVSIREGLTIMEALQGRLPGTAIPRYMIDLPGGGGKVPLQPEYVREAAGGVLTVRNFKGDLFEYPLDA